MLAQTGIDIRQLNWHAQCRVGQRGRQCPHQLNALGSDRFSNGRKGEDRCVQAPPP